MKLNTIERGEARKGGGGPEPRHTRDDLPVVFLHGLLGRARNFGSLQRLVAAERRTLAVDLRSHGASPHGPMEYHAMAADVHETLVALDALPAIVIGHSMGGKTAMTFTLDHPECVAGLLVADMAPVRRGGTQDALIAAMQAVRFPTHLTLSDATDLMRTVSDVPGIRDLVAQNLRLGDDPGWAIGLDEIAASLEDIYDWPAAPDARFDGPTLFIRGGESPYVRDSDDDAIRRHFPHYRLETIGGAGHWVHAEAPQAFAALMLDFIAAVAQNESETADRIALR